MYEEYFGLKRPPFKITPDTSLFYDGGNRGDILGALVYAIHRGEGIVKVVGEVGSGKTMLCRMLQLKLPDTVEIIYIANPSVSAQDILFVIAHELELSVGKDASKHEVMHQLQDYLLQRHMEGKQVVLFIEEAQGMPLDTLEEIRLLSNLETDQNKLLQIILFGQPELDDNLAQKSIRQLRERITHSFSLPPLSTDEIHHYMNFRMREVGYTGPELIDKNLARKIGSYSGGLLRRINIIADKILLSAFAEGTHNLSSKHVLAAVNDSNFGNPAPKKVQSFWLGAAILILMAGTTLYLSQAYWLPTVIGDSGVATVDDEERKITKTEAKITENSRQSVDPQTNSFKRSSEPETVSMRSQTTVPIEIEKPAEEPLRKKLNEVAGDPASTENTNSVEPSVQRNAAMATSNESSQSTAIKGDAADLTVDDDRWLNGRLLESRNWLAGANRNNVSIQVMVRRKSAAKELVRYLRNEWPLDLEQTYLFEVDTKKQNIFRVFYSEFDTVASGQRELGRLPDSIKVNQPYIQSVYRIREALL